MVRKLLVFVLLYAGLAFAQGAQRIGQATQSVNGFVKVVSGAAIAVCTYPSCGAATIYEDVALTIPITQPLFADVNGNFMYFAAAGNYLENITSPGTSPVTNVISLDQGTIANFASPPPIGFGTPNIAQFTILNGVIDAILGTGSDIGAKINNVISANSCGSTTYGCAIHIPPGTASYATAIVLPQNTTVQCDNLSGWSSEESSSPTATNLTYTGSGVAVTLSGVQAQFRNCGLTLSSTTTIGVAMTAPNTVVDGDYIINGGVSTKLISMNGGGAGIESPKIRNTDLYNFVGIGVYCAWTNDALLDHVIAYGATGQSTSQSLWIDSQCNGTVISTFTGGFSGLHGLHMSDSLSAGPPRWLFADKLITDCSRGGDGWLFDADLGGQVIEASFTNSWSAGAGYDCNSSTVTTVGAAGVHISGGAGISIIGGAKFRSNVGDGFLIDNANAQNILISDNFIWNNNFGSDHGDYDGVHITATGGNVKILDNDFSVAPESGGFQHYGVKIDATNPLNTLVTGDTCGNNTLGCYTYVKNVNYPYPIVNNNMLPSGGPNPLQTSLGDFSVQSFQQAVITPHMIPAYGAADNFQMGFGFNCYFDGTNWHFPTDTTNNGGVCWLGAQDGSTNVYHIPTNTPASDQVIAPGSLPAATWSISNTGVFNFGVAPMVNNHAFINLAGTLLNGVPCNSGSPSSSTFCNGVGAWANPFLTGTTSTVTGTSLTATCDSGTAVVTGATVGHPVSVSTTDGTDVGGAFYLRASVTSSNTVTVYVCGTGTPPSKAYSVSTQ